LLLALLLGLATLLAAGNGPPPARAADAPNLAPTDMTVAPASVSFSEQVTVTITLRNTGSAATTADVAVPLPADLSLVNDSVTGGGGKQGNAMTWDNVPVPAGQTVPLTFKLTPAKQIVAPATVVLKAAITGGGRVFLRVVAVTLTPRNAPAPANLAGSDKTASQPTLAPSEILIYTITLRNSGGSPAEVSVRDPLPERLEYVAGSANRGGSYDEESRTVTWPNLTVPAGGSIALTFQVTPAVYVIAPTPLTNTALITAGDATFSRSVTVLLTMLPIPPVPQPVLGGSFKAVSSSQLRPDDVATYTVNLHNSSVTDVTAGVRDPLPEGLTYVDGSASDGGQYDQQTRTLNWTNLNVPAGGDRALTFQVRQATPVTRPTMAINVATITSGDLSLQRRAPLLLVPADEPRPPVRPIVQRLEIGNGDVVTDRKVTLKITLNDGATATRMYIQEWQLGTRPIPRWRPDRGGPWVPFRSEVEWQLGPEAGTHVIGVWVADADGHVSQLTRRAIDFVSLTVPGEVPERGMTPYLVAYDAGVEVTATLTTTSGDADLYIWGPGSRGLPDEASTLDGTAVDRITFTTPRAGVYLFLVYGAKASSYTLAITPGGGPRAPVAAPQAGKPRAFTSEPVLSQAGLDPLGVATTPPFFNNVYMPLAARQ
jgi:uncharacterized repeat protein (TIGR01451 family)